MSRPSVQAPAAVVMVRPHHFSVNTETAQDNAFQANHGDADSAQLARRAYDEHSAAVAELERHGVRVHVFEGDDAATPDCVFPNNWFSTHAGGHVAIYPMKAMNRRRERRSDIIEMLKTRYRVQDVIDYSGLEPDGLFLEGTGAMVLDHIGRIAYAVASERTNPIALERFCTHFGFEPMVFPAADARGTPIYHTNVLMCIGTDFALIGDGMITDRARRKEVVARLEESGRRVVRLTEAQIGAFAGNAIELQGRDARLLALSRTAFDALTVTQRATITESATLVPLSIPTLEMAGGSVRCTMAGIHLAPRR
ncbi:arginine deiminase-related protein [Paracoccus onubensis]|uniref:citrulline utilization hydrolase CtlX n=1 Tax=Paracoccus onubensis TaxID=1675788 RepID=UPI00272FFCA2|nr:arginine deiminase-related protein [Paracoccus onubensis]MDP0926297.1 arginine deiminase-related protein [Paracoccus onubensis]